MLRRSHQCHESFRQLYHRINLPRRIALARYKQNLVAIKQRKEQKAAPSTEVQYGYNRWWCNEDLQFVHQFAFTEDPAVTKKRKEFAPSVTEEGSWRKPHQPTFLPFAPFIRVVDYPKDPDAKFLKQVNVPRWKDFMVRDKPVVPRTWY